MLDIFCLLSIMIIELCLGNELVKSKTRGTLLHVSINRVAGSIKNPWKVGAVYGWYLAILFRKLALINVSRKQKR
ncbi:hypothetical protein RJT34_25100 [Clitoria ternatea]|uniref:Uncharacterized protein n=1 Tax=Clitoria ternatea TaxID=43366 RepID=A0AAN9FXF3_CLITE